MSKLIQLSFVDFEIRLLLLSPFLSAVDHQKEFYSLFLIQKNHFANNFCIDTIWIFLNFSLYCKTFNLFQKKFSLPDPMMAQSSGYFSTARTKMNFQNEFCEKFTMRMRNANAQTHTPARERKSVEQMRVWARESHTPTHCNEL